MLPVAAANFPLQVGIVRAWVLGSYPMPAYIAHGCITLLLQFLAPEACAKTDAKTPCAAWLAPASSSSHELRSLEVCACCAPSNLCTTNGVWCCAALQCELGAQAISASDGNLTASILACPPASCLGNNCPGDLTKPDFTPRHSYGTARHWT